jgi:isoleucyl-tRNA synthetase
VNIKYIIQHFNFKIENQFSRDMCEERKLVISQKIWIFYGPPYANGAAHSGHLFGLILKDIFARYYKKSECRKGLDEHGKGVLDSTKKLGIINEHDSSNVIIEKCQKFSTENGNKWRNIEGFMGLKPYNNGYYRTSDFDYMNTQLKVFHRLWEKGFIFNTFRVGNYDPEDQTIVSNNDIKKSEKKLKTKCIVFIVESRGLNMFVYTSTPWTIPCNTGIGIGPNIIYTIFKIDGKEYVISSATWDKNPENENVSFTNFPRSKCELVKTLPGTELLKVLSEYKPPFQRYDEEGKSYKYTFVKMNGVSKDKGTGFVHLSPAFSKVDHAMMDSLPDGSLYDPFDESMTFKYGFLRGLKYDTTEMYKTVVDHLMKNDQLILEFTKLSFQDQHERSGTEIIQRANPTWCFETSKIVDKAIKLLATVNLVNPSLRRLLENWLGAKVDWDIGRTPKSNPWASVIPVFICTTDPSLSHVFTSAEDMSSTLGYEIKDLHSNVIDKIVFYKNGKEYKWCNMMCDVWFDSAIAWLYTSGWEGGSEPPAPADLICEGMDQVRGWFYGLIVLHTALFDKILINTIVSYGPILDRYGKKISKSKNPGLPVNELIDKYGEALRVWYLNPALFNLRAIKFSDSQIMDIKNNVIDQLLQISDQAINYENLYIKNGVISDEGDLDIMDKWLFAKVNSLENGVSSSIESCCLHLFPPMLRKFIDDLKYYCQKNKQRLTGKDGYCQAMISIKSLISVIINMSIVAMPFIPITCEKIRQKFLNTDVDRCNYISLTNNTNVEGVIDTLHAAVSITEEVRSRSNFKSRKYPVNIVVYCDDEKRNHLLSVLYQYKTQSSLMDIEFKFIDSDTIETKYIIDGKLIRLHADPDTLSCLLKNIFKKGNDITKYYPLDTVDNIVLDVDFFSITYVFKNTKDDELWSYDPKSGILVTLLKDQPPHSITFFQLREEFRLWQEWRTAAGFKMKDNLFIRGDGCTTIVMKIMGIMELKECTGIYLTNATEFLKILGTGGEENTVGNVEIMGYAFTVHK